MRLAGFFRALQSGRAETTGLAADFSERLLDRVELDRCSLRAPARRLVAGTVDTVHLLILTLGPVRQGQQESMCIAVVQTGRCGVMCTRAVDQRRDIVRVRIFLVFWHRAKLVCGAGLATEPQGQVRSASVKSVGGWRMAWAGSP